MWASQEDELGAINRVGRLLGKPTETCWGKDPGTVARETRIASTGLLAKALNSLSKQLSEGHLLCASPRISEIPFRELLCKALRGSTNLTEPTLCLLF